MDPEELLKQAMSEMRCPICSLVEDFEFNRLCEKVGANAILAVSLAIARAAANEFCMPLDRYVGSVDASLLPVPCLNVINGGRHADNNVDFQEFMIALHNAPSFAEAIRIGIETFHALKSILIKKGYVAAVGDEGGFAPNLKSNVEAIELNLEASTTTGYLPDADVTICLDPATSEMWENGKYVFFKSDKSSMTSEQMVRHWADGKGTRSAPRL